MHRHLWRASIGLSREAGHATFSNDSSVAARGATSQARDVLGKVVIPTPFIATLPITSTERYNAAASTRTTHATHATAKAASMHVTTTHHARVTKLCATVRRGLHSIGLAVRIGTTRTHGGEGTAEACRATLEIGEATAGARPITRSWSVLGRRKWREERWTSRWLRVSCTIEHSTRRGGNLNGAIIERAPVHTQTFCCLRMSIISTFRR